MESVEETMEVFGEVTISLGVIYAMKASLEPSLNRYAVSLLNKAQGLCSQVRQMEQQEEAKKKLQYMSQCATSNLDESEEWETSGAVYQDGDSKRTLRAVKKERRQERKREKREAKEQEKLREQRAKESPSGAHSHLFRLFSTSI